MIKVSTQINSQFPHSKAHLSTRVPSSVLPPPPLRYALDQRYFRSAVPGLLNELTGEGGNTHGVRYDVRLHGCVVCVF